MNLYLSAPVFIIERDAHPVSNPLFQYNVYLGPAMTMQRWIPAREKKKSLFTIIAYRYIVYYYSGIAVLFGDASLSIVELIATIGNQELTLS